MAANNQKVICLMGPTASGKTALALEICDNLPCEIVSVDSAMVYQGMAIGSAKPSAEILAKYPHHLIDLCSVTESYSTARFCADVRQVIDDIFARKKIPLLVGGTMLYFNALLKGLAPLPSADETIRADILARAEEKGWHFLHQQLSKIDLEAAQRIHPNDKQRLQRALEVYQITGKSLTELQKQAEHLKLSYPTQCFAIAPHDRKVLHKRIAQRFDQMLDDGLVEEVKTFFDDENISPELPAMRAVGYRQVWQYLAGKYSYEQMREKGIVATRQLAKRQLTWLRSWPDLHWLDSEDDDLIKLLLSIAFNRELGIKS